MRAHRIVTVTIACGSRQTPIASLDSASL